MSKAFEKMMQGLKEVEAYMAGEREGFRVHVPEAVDEEDSQRSADDTSELFGFLWLQP